MLEQQLLEAAPAVKAAARQRIWRRRGLGFLALAACLALAVAAAFAFLGNFPKPEGAPDPELAAKPEAGDDTLVVLGGPLPSANAPQAPRMFEPMANYFLENVDMILIGVVDDPVERKVALPKKKNGLGGIFEKTEYRTEKLFRVKVDKILYGAFDGDQVQMNDSKPILGCIPTADEMRKPSDDFKKGSRLLIYLGKINGKFYPRQFLRLEGKEDKLPADLSRFLAFVNAAGTKDAHKRYRDLLETKGLDVPAYVALTRTQDKAAADVLVDMFETFQSRGLKLEGPIVPGKVGNVSVSVEFQRLLALLAQYGDTRKLQAVLDLPVEYRRVSLSYLSKMCRSANDKELALVRDRLLPMVQKPGNQQDSALLALAQLSKNMDAATQAKVRKQVVGHLQAIRGNDDRYLCYPLLAYLLERPDDDAIEIVMGMVERQPVSRINELCQQELWSSTLRMTEAQHAGVVKRWQALADKLKMKAKRTQEEQSLLVRLQANLRQPRPHVP